MIRQFAVKVTDCVKFIFTSEQTITIRLYMKSGNVIRLTRLKKFNIHYEGFDISSVSWTTLGNTKLLHIDGSQIEAVVQEM